MPFYFNVRAPPSIIGILGLLVSWMILFVVLQSKRSQLRARVADLAGDQGGQKQARGGLLIQTPPWAWDCASSRRLQ